MANEVRCQHGRHSHQHQRRARQLYLLRVRAFPMSLVWSSISRRCIHVYQSHTILSQSYRLLHSMLIIISNVILTKYRVLHDIRLLNQHAAKDSTFPAHKKGGKSRNAQNAKGCRWSQAVNYIELQSLLEVKRRTTFAGNPFRSSARCHTALMTLSAALYFRSSWSSCHLCCLYTCLSLG